MNIENDQTGTQSLESSGSSETDQASQVIDLDGVSTFKFQGETYTPNQFVEFQRGFQQYGEASKYVEEDKKYWANVYHDIEKVLKNPSRADEFRGAYPERFHALLDRQLNGTGQQVEKVQNQTSQQLPREVGEKLSDYERRLAAFEKRAYDAEVAAATAKIDALLPTLMKKYEMADQDKVLFEAEKFLNKGGKLTDSTWERLVKEDHDRNTSRADKFYKTKLDSQIKQGQKGKDIGVGGATPGNAPVKMNFSQAQDEMIKSLRSRGYK